MDNIEVIAIDESNKDKVTFIPILIESNESKTNFLLYGNVPIVFFIISLIILNYIVVTINFSYLNGLAGLLSASLLTLLLLISWEGYKSRNKEKIYNQAFMKELESNMMLMYSNLEKLNIESKKFDKNEMNVFDIEPCYHVQFDIWNSLNQNMSLDFLKIDVRNFDAFIFESNKFNEMLEARDNTLKSPLINVEPTEDTPLGIFTNIFLIKKQYNKMLLKQCKKVIQYLEKTLKSRGKLTKLDSNARNQYTSFNDAIENNKVIISNQEEKNKYEMLYSDENHQLIFYQYHI